MKLSEIIYWARNKGFVFEFTGNEDELISGFSSLSHYKEDTITWIKKKMPEDKLVNGIKCAVVSKGITADIPNCFFAENSKELFFEILKEFFSSKEEKEAIGKHTYIGTNVSICDDVTIGSNCSLDGEITIGKGTVIENNVVLMNKVTIGKNCIIHSGTVIGKDGFGFAFDKDNIPVKVPHFGGVVIGDRVEIGANCTIDRGTIDDTVIGDDVKIDNLALIAHNVIIEAGTMILGCTSLGGSVHIGSKSYIGPHVFVKNQTSVGDNTLVGMATVISEPIESDLVFAMNQKRPVKMKDYRKLL